MSQEDRSYLDRQALLRALDEAIDRGVSDVYAGRVKPAEEVFGRLAAKYRAMKRPGEQS